jgi:hypothetical protein
MRVACSAREYLGGDVDPYEQDPLIFHPEDDVVFEEYRALLQRL